MAFGGSSFYKGSDLIHDYSCSKCEENDLNTEAQHFCPECEHYLCDKCVRIHGEYFKKHVVYGRGDIQKWTGFSMDRCDQHGNKLEVHCDDHQELCCHVCVSLNHRFCSSISHLPELARGFLEKAEFKQLPEAVDKMRSRLDELKNAKMKDQASLKDSYKNILAEIKALRKEFNQILDELEKKTVEQLDSMKKDLEKSLKDDIEKCTHMNELLKTMIDKFRQITGKNKETNCYVGHRKCKTKLTEAQNLLHEIQEKPVETLCFKYDSSIMPFLRNLNMFGATERVISKAKRLDSGYVYKGQGSKKFSVRIKKDKNTCSIEGICELPSGDLVIADSNNRRLKLLDMKYKVTAHLDCPASPEHLCHTTGSEVAVVTYEDKTYIVYFLTVTRGQLHLSRKFTTDHDCTSIAYHEGLLYVGSDSALYQYTMDGLMGKVIYEERGVAKCAVSPDGERFYITTLYGSKLITLDKNGQVLSKLRDPELKTPRGVCVSPSGHVFVCGYMSDTVVQVDREGRQKLATVATEADDLACPQSVWFSEQTSSLIVGNDDDSIVVIKLC
ncbi:uncharacterized protein LOC128243321 [Mya arenaria]|uniref:uncharacterized protein LOC128243321 n=1 Tax=Mya arenaria TaxID=6604 RepID=UPI0022E2C9C4|nr:uncharacterized protein LOC128243321 [Mya arenaria]